MRIIFLYQSKRPSSHDTQRSDRSKDCKALFQNLLAYGYRIIYFFDPNAQGCLRFNCQPWYGHPHCILIFKIYFYLSLVLILFERDVGTIILIYISLGSVHFVNSSLEFEFCYSKKLSQTITSNFFTTVKSSHIKSNLNSN